MKQQQNETWKGYLFVFISIIATSNVYLFSKAAFREIDLAQFGFYWFLFGMGWNLLFNTVSGKLRCIQKVNKKGLYLLVIIGLLEIAGTSLFFYSISVMKNPAIVSFIANTGPLFVGILGFIFLHERFRRLEIIGLIVTLLGALIISYKPGSISESIFISGAGYVVLSSLLFAISSILVKKNIKAIDPTVLSMNRSLFIFGFSAIAMFATGSSFYIPQTAFINVLLGSILGPFLTVYAGYTALKYIEASRASVIGSSKGLFVMMGSWLIFGILPLSYQIIGGIISIFGVVLLTVGKNKWNIFDLRYKIIRKKD